MNPSQARTYPAVNGIAGSRCATRNTLIGFGVLVFTLCVETAPVYGKSPAGEFIAVTPSPNVLERTRWVGYPQTNSYSGVRLKIQPHTSGPLDHQSARNLFTGFSVALERVRDLASCSALFDPLDTSGVEMITNSFYIEPSVAEKRELCTGGVTAFTQVGSRVTRLCPSFGDVDRQTAALLLIHEALHSAGMPESPSTAGALTPMEINNLVKKACGL